MTFREKPPTKILIVDDVASSRLALREILIAMGYHDVDECSDGDEAFETVKKASSDPYKLIISDLHMPKMPGLQFLKEIRKNKGTEKVPFIMVTSASDKDNVLEAIKAGASDYIVKPYYANLIEEKINSALEKAAYSK